MPSATRGAALAQRSFVLLVARRGCPRRELVVPGAPSYLTHGRDRELRLHKRVPRAAQRTGGGARLIALEPVVVHHQPHLLMLLPANGVADVRLNGALAAPVGLLRVGDELRFRDHVVHVSARRDDPLGRVVDEAGRECPVCRAQLAAGDAVYRCVCGAALHCASESDGGEGALDCARVVPACLRCGREIGFDAGLEYQPEE